MGTKELKWTDSVFTPLILCALTHSKVMEKLIKFPAFSCYHQHLLFTVAPFKNILIQSLFIFCIEYTTIDALCTILAFIFNLCVCLALLSYSLLYVHLCIVQVGKLDNISSVFPYLHKDVDHIIIHHLLFTLTLIQILKMQRGISPVSKNSINANLNIHNYLNRVTFKYCMFCVCGVKRFNKHHFIYHNRAVPSKFPRFLNVN